MLELYTFRMSHFSEKARWMLDASHTEYREVRWTPFFHVLPALRLGRLGTTVPILHTASGYVQDSTRILNWLDTNLPGFNLVPRDPLQRREVMELEDRFDRIGAHVIRYAYSVALEDRDAVVELWTLDASPLQRRVIEAGFPLMRSVFRKRMKISPESVQQARKRIGEALDELDARVADGRTHLVGDRLSVADITAAALLAPLIGPDEHEIYSREDFRETLRPLVSDWMSRPSARWVRELYRKHRHLQASGSASSERR